MDVVRSSLQQQTELAYGPCDVRYNDHCMIMRIRAVPQFIVYIRNDDGMYCYYVHEDDLKACDHEHGEFRAWREQQCYRMFWRYAKADFLSIAKHYLTTAVENMRSHPLSGWKRPLTMTESTWQVKNIVEPDPRTCGDKARPTKYKKPRLSECNP